MVSEIVVVIVVVVVLQGSDKSGTILGTTYIAF